MDIQKSIMDIHKCIMDIHKEGINTKTAPHMHGVLVRKIKNKRLGYKNDSEMKTKMIVLGVNKMELKAD